MKTNQFRLPAYWASYLVNGDDSGLTREEILACEAWEVATNPGNCVSCDKSEELSRSHDAWDFWPYSGATELYTFLVSEEDET